MIQAVIQGALALITWHHMERATYYNADPNQCQGNHLTTADGSRINAENPQRWVALSRDQLTRWNGSFSYGDTIIVRCSNSYLVGEWVVRDCMNARYKKSIDFLLPFGVNIGRLDDVRIKKLRKLSRS